MGYPCWVPVIWSGLFQESQEVVTWRACAWVTMDGSVLWMDIGDGRGLGSGRQDGRVRYWNQTVQGPIHWDTSWGVEGVVLRAGGFFGLSTRLKVLPTPQCVFLSAGAVHSQPLPKSSGSGLNDLRLQPQAQKRGSISSIVRPSASIFTAGGGQRSALGGHVPWVYLDQSHCLCLG